MSAAVLYFTPKVELSRQENLKDFIDLCRQSKVLDSLSQFDLNVWTTKFRKGKPGRQRFSFSTLENAADKSASIVVAMPEPFLSFSKAMLVYMDDRAPVISHGQRLAALRCLEAALRTYSKDGRPTGVNADVLNAAIELASRQFTAGVAYRVAGQLEKIADLMRKNGFIDLRSKWVHGLKKPTDLGSRISKEALDARQDKLPSAAAIQALGGIFANSKGGADEIVSSFTALMMCAPERINEVLRLSRNCIAEGEGRYEGKLGIRWPGSKLSADTTKWLPTKMAPIARESIARLQQATEFASKLAQWYTDNPNKLYLHNAVEHLRNNELISTEELSCVLWGELGKKISANAWARSKKLQKFPLGGRKVGYRFADIEAAVVAMLPPTFPYVPGDSTLKFCDSLAVVRYKELAVARSSWLCMFEYVGQGAIADRLGAGEKHGKKSIFTRNGYTEDDGNPIVVNTHSFRHYLNMLAQVGGLTDTEIAIFSGRKDERHNRTYDHMSSDEVQKPISRAISSGFMGQIVAAAGCDLVNRSNFRGIGLAAAHTTEYGYCDHNFAAEPCQLHHDCLNCCEQFCVKGERHKEDNLRKLKEETELLLRRARAALQEEEYGADLWVKHQSKTLERVVQLLSLIEDPKIPIGARIRLDLDPIPLVRGGVETVIKIPSPRQRTLQ